MTALPQYVELRCLSNFSFLRGASWPEELVARAKALGYGGLALTDECSLAGIVRAHVAAKEHGLPLLVGSQFQVQGEAPFEVRWQVSDKSGKNLFFNIIIEGVNMLASERAEVGAMLDKRKGDIDGLIGDLQTA